MARSETQNQRMRDESREQILSSALKVFAEKGLAATRISDIAAQAEISQGLLYHYFRTKEEIYVELVRGAFGGMNEAALALEQLPLSPREKIVRAITELMQLIESREDFADRFMLTAQASMSTAIPEEAKAIIRRQRGKPYEVLARILREGQRDGSIRDHDADELATVFWIAIKGLAMHRAAFGKAYRAPDPKLLTRIFLTEDEP